MKFCVLALDYDGTIASEGFLDPDVRAAITEVRAPRNYSHPGLGAQCLRVTASCL